ncbi:hypothetical protein [Chromobacterium alticapitis]|uniref:Uncharacterized protein n=1 Tax=Chromobacterium alticapitis TaxID=2073169 RepID=A0A2S5DH33_9NEIS|nr:hypothetical protein [Chromobacterium alticapitis]POZ62395.1 hypothetical protein C2I19_08555 [Chromobacterium alticapitis]
MISDDEKLSYTFSCPKCHSKIALSSTVGRIEQHLKAHDLVFHCMRCKRDRNAMDQDYEMLAQRLREKGRDI